MNTAADTADFARRYITAWSTTDPDERRALIEQLYAVDAEFFAHEPGDAAVHHHGREAIEQNITQVNERLTQGSGLATRSTGHTENHDLLRVSWTMTSPDGTIALTGMNLLLRNAADGLIARDYIIIE